MIDYKEKWEQQTEDIRWLLRQLERVNEILYNNHMSSEDKIEFIKNLTDDEESEIMYYQQRLDKVLSKFDQVNNRLILEQYSKCVYALWYKNNKFHLVVIINVIDLERLYTNNESFISKPISLDTVESLI